MNDLKLHSWPYFVGYKTENLYIKLINIPKSWPTSRLIDVIFPNFLVPICPNASISPFFALHFLAMNYKRRFSIAQVCYQQNIHTYITSFSSQSNKQFTNLNNTFMQNSDQNNKRKIEEHNS